MASRARGMESDITSPRVAVAVTVAELSASFLSSPLRPAPPLTSSSRYERRTFSFSYFSLAVAVPLLNLLRLLLLPRAESRSSGNLH